MIIVVSHKITNTAEFWAAAERQIPLLPESGVKRVILILPNKNMTEATCVWEATSVAALEVYLTRKRFDWSTETFYELNLAKATVILL